MLLQRIALPAVLMLVTIGSAFAQNTDNRDANNNINSDTNSLINSALIDNVNRPVNSAVNNPSKSQASQQLQAGKRLHNSMVELMGHGHSVNTAINKAIKAFIKSEDNSITAQSKAAVAFDTLLTKQFYGEMIETDSLIDVTKLLIEAYPDKIERIITLSIALYPHLANDVMEGAALSGTMSLEDILITALQAGADLNSIAPPVHRATIVVPPLAIPLGPGIGSDGNGSSHTTTPTN